MFDVIASLDAEGHTAERITPKEATCDASAPLVSGTFMLQLSPLFSISFAVRTLEEHCRALSVKSRQSNELSLLFSNQELGELPSFLFLG